MVRVGGANTTLLGIDREQERRALAVASAAGIGPEVVLLVLPEGHLVTRLIEGRHWTAHEYRRPENLERMAKAVKRIHALRGGGGTFSPFRRVEPYACQAKRFGVPLPEDFEVFPSRSRNPTGAAGLASVRRCEDKWR